MTNLKLAAAALLLMAAGPADPSQYPIAAAPYATAIGCWVRVTEDKAVGLGLSSTMATFHADGTWTVDWSEVDRVAALDPDSSPACNSQIVVAFARLLQSAHGQLKESQ